MQRRTHLIFGILFFIVVNSIFHLPILYGIFALLGSVFPDADLKFMHRKLLHNIWSLFVIVFLGMKFGLLNSTAGMLFSLGFISHLVSDSLTPTGIMPFWPIKAPRFRWKIRTGSSGEYLFSGIILLVIVAFIWLVK